MLKTHARSKTGWKMWAAPVLAAAILVPLGTAGAAPELKPGERMPDFVGDEFIHSEAFGMRDLRGRVVLIEIFSPG